MTNITIKAPIKATEDKIKVLTALKNIFPTIDFVRKENQLVGHSTNKNTFDHLLTMLKEQKILDSARNALHQLPKENIIKFYLNKQVAFVNKLNFCDNQKMSPLGAITVTIKFDTTTELITFVDNYFPKYEWIK